MDEAERASTIVAILREGDPDRYLATLFAPSSARDDLFALYALNVELARIGERVTEPDLGKIKLQWWREALARRDRGGNGKSRGSTRLAAFCSAIQTRQSRSAG